MKILICVGGMPYATPTLNIGSLIAKLSQSQITLFTVISNSVRKKDAEALLQEAQASLDMPVEALKCHQGNVVDEIIQETREGDYDMVVVGEHAIAGLIDLLLQTIPHKIAVQASTSVLVVKDDAPRLERILICTSGHPLNRPVVEFGARLAREAGAKARLLHVVSPAPGMYAGLGSMDESLSTLLQSNTPVANHLRWGGEVLTKHKVAADLALRYGIVADEIVHEVREGEYDLVIIGAKQTGEPLQQLLISQVMPEVVDLAPCSVLIVRPDNAFGTPTSGRSIQ